MFTVRQDDLSSQATLDLVALHHRDMHASSPLGQAFALDLPALKARDISVWSAWDGESIVAIGALEELCEGVGELKSMRTHASYLRRGAAAYLLEHLIAEAVRRGCKRLSLETGSGPGFEPALALYRKRGFKNGGAFSEYQPSPFNQFLHLAL